MDVENWKRLPLITSLQMREARQLKYIFTGNLEEPIISSPPFSGQEKHYLKAQIVRIDHANTLIPRGEYKIKKEEDEQINPTEFTEIEKEEEPLKKKLNFYDDANNWVHFYPNILLQGRVVHQELRFSEEDDIEDEEKENIKKYAVSIDPFEDRLKPITQDKDAEGEEIWV